MCGSGGPRTPISNAESLLSTHAGIRKKGQEVDEEKRRKRQRSTYQKKEKEKIKKKQRQLVKEQERRVRETETRQRQRQLLRLFTSVISDPQFFK